MKKTPMQELIKKWKEAPNEYGVYDIIGGLKWYAEEYNDKNALELAQEFIDDEEYEVKYLIQRVEQTFKTKER
jgi:hypothetical protein